MARCKRADGSVSSDGVDLFDAVVETLGQVARCSRPPRRFCILLSASCIGEAASGDSDVDAVGQRDAQRRARCGHGVVGAAVERAG